MLFPGNRNHQRVFVAIFVELKWADGQFLSALEPVADRHGLSRRTQETVRAKMRRLGLIDHVSRFNRKYGYREGWVFSTRFSKALNRAADLVSRLKEPKDVRQKAKEERLIDYI
ncbi:MAG: hypothetical protein NTW86_14315 [Candidatus Sumerlaeota bacterium]|nr:hypothetical protein [Candidatus Sumerlaeota bacterium]